MRRHVLALLEREIGRELYVKLFPSLPEFIRPFAPYAYGLQSSDTKCTLFYHPDLEHFTIQLPGTACSLLGDPDTWFPALRSHGYRCSRIDITADIPTNISPDVFVSARTSNRWRTISHVSSLQGESVYIGSPTSQRRAIVYRYNPPHPRHPYLRVEHRFRDERAKDMHELVAIHGVRQALAQCQEIWGWGHPVWDVGEIQLEEMPHTGTSAHSGSEVRWLLTQVIPALKRYEKEGKIDDVRAFLEEHLFSEERLDVGTQTKWGIDENGDLTYTDRQLSESSTVND